MRHMERRPDGPHDAHFDPEEMDLLAGVEARSDGIPGRLTAHLERCDECRREVAFLRSLHGRLATVSRPEPSPGFAGAVMSRVRLPVPWRQRAAETVRQRWPVLALATAVLLAALGGTAWWLGRQGLALTDVTTVALAGAKTLVLRALIAGGRILYDLGIVDAGAALRDAVGPGEALGALALLSLVGLAALGSLLKLMDRPLPFRGRPAGT